ncbi:MAG: hypothetical protein FWE82_01990, partial [Defluviitaleaceae bacterium]|nr:hypothetical protein [Defluviitaleaceae bacterium]
MRKLKRLTSLVIAFTMLLSLAVPIAANASDRVNLIPNGNFASGLGSTQNWDPKPYLDADGQPVDNPVDGGSVNPIYNASLLPYADTSGGPSGGNAWIFPSYNAMQTSVLVRDVNLQAGKSYEFSVTYAAYAPTNVVIEVIYDWATWPNAFSMSLPSGSGWQVYTQEFVADRNTGNIQIVVRNIDSGMLQIDEIAIYEALEKPCENCGNIPCDCPEVPGEWVWETISLRNVNDTFIETGGYQMQNPAFGLGAVNVGDQFKLAITYRSALTGWGASIDLCGTWGQDSIKVFERNLTANSGGSFRTDQWEFTAANGVNDSMILLHINNGTIEVGEIKLEKLVFKPIDIDVPVDPGFDIGHIFGNIFNQSDATAANANWAGDGLSIVDEGRGSGSPALRLDRFVGFVAVPLEANTEYKVSVYAKNTLPGAEEGPMRPRAGDDHETNKNKLSFQYNSASDDAEGYIGDRYNMYITNSEWGWTEMTFTTPHDMQPNWSGSTIIVLAMRASACLIDQFIVEKVSTGTNIFFGGNNYVSGFRFPAGNVWEGSYSEANEGPFITTPAVRVINGSGFTPIPIEAYRSYEAWVLAKGVGKVSFANIAEINVNTQDWRWYKTTFTAPAGLTDAEVVLSSSSTLWVEGIVAIDLNPPARPVNINLDLDTTYQTIEGFGFFGSMNVWWSGNNPNTYYNQAWIDQILFDLGITMWRNEVYPFLNPACGVNNHSALNPNCNGSLNCCRSDFDRGLTNQRPAGDNYSGSIGNRGQDSSWGVQKHMVEALWNTAVANDIDLKIILSAWTPPAQWKTNQSSKGGGVIMPEYYESYGHWWVEVLDMYKA